MATRREMKRARKEQQREVPEAKEPTVPPKGKPGPQGNIRPTKKPLVPNRFVTDD